MLLARLRLRLGVRRGAGILVGHRDIRRIRRRIRRDDTRLRDGRGGLLAGLRPLLMPTRPDDAAVKVGFSDDKWFLVPGSGAIAEEGDGVIYLAIPVRNVGSGIAVLHGWHFHADPALDGPGHDRGR